LGKVSSNFFVFLQAFTELRVYGKMVKIKEIENGSKIFWDYR